MSLENAVAVERRMDLASLFCMIGRHGPAVVVAVLAMVSLLAGFIIYRTVRGKRRKATAADSDGKPPGAERDAPVIQPNPEENQNPVRATELSDGGSLEVKEDVNSSDHNIRHRRAAAVAPAEKPSPYFTPKDDLQAPEIRHTFSDDRMEMPVVEDSLKVAETWVKEAHQSYQSDAYAEADCHHIASHEVIEDVVRGIHDISSSLDERIFDESNKKEKVLKAECQDDEYTLTDKVVPETKTRQEEENIDDRPQDNVTINETNSVGSLMKEPFVRLEDAPVSIITNVKEEESEPQDPDGVVSDNCHSPKEQKKTECEEAEEECEDYLLNPQQAVSQLPAFEQEINLPSLKEDQHDHVTDEEIPLIEGCEGVKSQGPTEEVCEEVTDKDNMDNLPAVDTHLSQFKEVEQKEETVTCSQEDGVLFGNDNRVSEKNLAKDDIMTCMESCAESSSASLDFQQTQKEYEMTFSLDEDKASSTLESVMLSEDTEDKKNDPTVVLAGPNIAASDGGNAESLLTAEEKSPSHVSSCYREQQSVKMIDGVSGQENGFAVANAAENIISPESVEKTSYPVLLTTCQDQQGDQMGNGNLDLLIHSSFEAPSYNVHPTEPLTIEEMSFLDLTSFPQDQKATLLMSCSQDQQSVHLKNSTEQKSIDTFDKASLTPCQSDMFPSCQDQLSNQGKNTDDFSEVTTSSALDMAAGLSSGTFPICMPSFEHGDLGFSDLSSPDVGKESGISSMAVSPDLKDTGFDVGVENIVEGNQLSAAQTDSKNSFSTNDITVSYKYNGNTSGMVFGPYPTRQPHPLHAEQTDWTGYESFATNEDTFGHEVEDRYHREMHQFMAQIVDSITSLADELTEKTDTKVSVEAEEKKEKKAEVRVGMKAETKTDEEEAVEFEKTEISIMEATMDHNEWITDSNYQVLPWMSISAPSVAQNHNRNNQLSSEKCAAETDAPCADAPDDLPVTEVKPTSSPTLIDESNKKVLAVQPMPQNVNVTFRVHYFTQSPYQTVAVTGDQQELGNWKEFISLERAKDGHWTRVVSLPAESHVEWKFLLLDKGEVCRWEECGNRLLETGSGDDLLVHKWWGTL